MSRMNGKKTHTHTQVSLIPPWEDQREWHRMTRMTRPDCAVMCNLINTHTHTHTQRAPRPPSTFLPDHLLRPHATSGSNVRACNAHAHKPIVKRKTKQSKPPSLQHPRSHSKRRDTRARTQKGYTVATVQSLGHKETNRCAVTTRVKNNSPVHFLLSTLRNMMY